VKTARDLLFDGFGAEYHEIGHIRLRKYGCLLGAEQELEADFFFRRGLTAIPLIEQCRRLALEMEFKRRAAQPPSKEFPDGEPERDFSLEEKTGALMLLASQQRAGALRDHILAEQALVATPKHADALAGLFQMMAMNRPEAEQAPLVGLALRYRGEVRDPVTGGWLPFHDLEDADVKALPGDVMNRITEFINWERNGWPKEGDEMGKSRSRRSSSSSKTSADSSKTLPSP
jgi:hypothetical protein